MTIDALQAQRRKILALAVRHGVRDVRVFGSILRGDAGPSSDVGLLLNVDPGRTLLDVIALEQALEDSWDVQSKS